MTQALVNANVPMPSLNRRIWQVLKDKGEATAASLARTLGVSQSSVSSMCSRMLRRKMLEHRTQTVKTRVGHGWGERKVSLYRVPPGMLEFELLPEPADHDQPRRGRGRPRVVVPATYGAPVVVGEVPRAETTAKVRQQEDVLDLVAHLRLSELRALQVRLNEIFKETA